MRTATAWSWALMSSSFLGRLEEVRVSGMGEWGVGTIFLPRGLLVEGHWNLSFGVVSHQKWPSSFPALVTYPRAESRLHSKLRAEIK